MASAVPKAQVLVLHCVEYFHHDTVFAPALLARPLPCTEVEYIILSLSSSELLGNKKKA